MNTSIETEKTFKESNLVSSKALSFRDLRGPFRGASVHIRLKLRITLLITIPSLMAISKQL